MATRFVEGLQNHERLEKFSYKKYEQRSPLGQLQAMHNVSCGATFLSVQPPPRADILARSSVSYTADDLRRQRESSKQEDENFYRNSFPRNKPAPVWVKVPSHSEMWESCALQEAAKTRQVVFSRSKSQGVRDSVVSKSAPARKAGKGTARRPLTNSTLYRFKPVDIKTACSKENIHLCTALIKEQWDSRERQYISTGIYARGKSEAKDNELQQWLTFEGDSPGALSAFTQGDGERTSEHNPKFSIEANVGKDVAAKLVLGGKVRIGKNGKLLLGQLVDEADESAVFYDKCESILAMTRGAAQKHEPLYPPLCWHDVEKEAKLIVPKFQNNFNSSAQASRTVPVVYNSSPTIKPYVPPGVQSDDSKLHSLLSHKPTHKPPQAEVEMTYEQILELHTPQSSRRNKSDLIPAPTPENTMVEPQKLNRTGKPPRQSTSRIVPHNSSARVRTPTIPEEVRCGIQRQVTMPSYKVIPGKPIEKVAGRPKTGQDPFERSATPTRPPKYTPSYGAGGGTTPTISQNGVEGDKSFVKITSPLNQSFKYDSSEVRGSVKVDEERGSKTAPVYKEHRTRINNTPADLSAVTLVGKASPMEKPSRVNQKAANHLLSESEVKESQATITDISGSDSSLTQLPNKLAINIPAVDMISASSAAVNSIADFQEFDVLSHKFNDNTMAADVNNNNQSVFSADTVSSEHIDNSVGGQEKAPSMDSFDDVEEFSISVDISNNVADVPR